MEMEEEEEMEDEKYVQELKTRLVDELQQKFGFAGLADGEKMFLVNSGKGNIQIKVTWE